MTTMTDATPPIPVLVIGEALIDIVVPLSGAGSEHVGGSPANVAVGLARLGHPTTLATRFGRDERGERIKHLLTDEQVHLAPGSDTAHHTSTALARLDANHVATYEFDLDWPLQAGGIDLNAGHVHTGSIAATLLPGAHAVADVISTCRATATISYDPNVRPSLMGEPSDVAIAIEQLISLADVVKASEEDVQWLYSATPEEVIDRWAPLGPRLIVITLGAQGALVSIDGRSEYVPATQVEVVDTVGAGDSFMSGLISGLIDANMLGGLEARRRLATADLSTVRAAVQRAIACSSVTVSRAGSNPPRRAELTLE